MSASIGDYTTHLAAAPLVGFVLWLIARRAQRAFRNLPPGPKGLPIVGDVVHMADLDWLMSSQRKDEYGEMMYVSALGQGVLIINSARVAIDLLEKRSDIYSDRPHYISASEFSTQDLVFSLTAYGDLWRRFRRVAVEGFSKSTVRDFYPIQGREALMLALALMKNPSTLEKHLQRHAWSVMLSVSYHSPPVDSVEDPVVVRIAKQVERLLHEMQPGSRLVEFFTWMRHIPSRFAKWKRDAEYWFVQDSLMYEGLLGKVANDLVNGIDRPSFGASVIQNQSKHDLSEREQAWLVGTMVSVGGETTSTTLLWWVLAMLAYPEVQTRAHVELDEVVGSARPPTFADLPSLPYIRAMVKEILRWAPTVPLGMPHVSTEDDWYEGMFIPKGTGCLQNMRTLNFDPEVYGSNAMDFDPARYLDENGQAMTLLEGRKAGHMSFGFGRRICPGRYVAEWTLAIDMATVLWAMRFERPEGAQGELDVRTMVHCGTNSNPKPFECKMIPRFTEAEALLTDTLNLYG
ncbi:cytochrome P450 [Lactarius pseudohatsudake]|nr:cytochrome P450 [Lactarius pseudohatsudake]